MISATYRHEMQAARRDVVELCELLLNPDGKSLAGPVECRDLSLKELMQAIGLATMTHDALLRAAKARESTSSLETQGGDNT